MCAGHVAQSESCSVVLRAKNTRHTVRGSLIQILELGLGSESELQCGAAVSNNRQSQHAATCNLELTLQLPDQSLMSPLLLAFMGGGAQWKLHVLKPLRLLNSEYSRLFSGVGCLTTSQKADWTERNYPPQVSPLIHPAAHTEPLITSLLFESASKPSREFLLECENKSRPEATPNNLNFSLFYRTHQKQSDG